MADLKQKARIFAVLLFLAAVYFFLTGKPQIALTPLIVGFVFAGIGWLVK